MKKLFLLPILLCLCVLQAFAFDYTDDNGVTWTVSYNNYYYGGAYHYYYTITAAANYGDEVVIPETVYEDVSGTPTARTIEAIGTEVFKNNLILTTVTLPATMKYIGDYAFYGCTGLTAVNNMDGVEYIYYNAFLNCTSLASVDLSSCQRIEYNAFSNCSALTSIGSLAACNYVGNNAFNGCSNLQTVDIQAGTTIGYYAFYQCSSLKTVGTLKDCTIGSEAFRGCTSLTAVDLSEATSVGSYAFYGCFKMTSAGDLSAFEAIADGVFYDCEKLDSANLSNCKTIGNSAFYNCWKLKNVDLHNVKSIGTKAFAGCSSLEEVGDISAFTTIPDYLFNGCTKLKDVSLPNVTTIGSGAFSGCQTFTVVNLPEVTTISESAFSSCQALTEINLPKVITIGTFAFSGCTNLNAPQITSTSLTSIGSRAFSVPGTITLMTTTPPTLGGNDAFGDMMVIRVPDAAVAAYRAADVWSDSKIKPRILGIGTQIDYDVNVTALADSSVLHKTIGENNLGNVVSLKVTGSINSYDIMVLRNKTDNLHYLDLSDANIVASNYEYYTGYHTEDNVLGGYSFYGLTKLLTVKLPQSITAIGNSAFYGCCNLKEVEFQTGIESIGSKAFVGCGNLSKLELKSGLKNIGYEAFGGDYYYDINGNYMSGRAPKYTEVILPEGLESIGSYAFTCNTQLKRIAFPSSLKTIGSYAFSYCSSIDSISLPLSLQNIPTYAFYRCSNLVKIEIPSTIQSVGNYAFSDCPKLADVYTYIAEPTPIEMNTFSTYKSADLHVPTTSYWTYWYNTQWSQFRSLQEFDAEYQYFYINNDFSINDKDGEGHGGTMQGENIDADLNPGSGLIINTDPENPQNLDEVHINVNDSHCGSIIASNNLNARRVYFDITVQKGRWYFFCFPFAVRVTNITAPNPYTWRTYDPSERANGKTGWQNWIGDWLYAGQGYIFHTSKAGVLSVCVEREDGGMNWQADNRPHDLQTNAAENQQDASWNFIGNPHTSYYDIDQTGFTQPFTVWNGTSYVAVRPGDDAYALSPFQAFFIQKPNGNGNNAINFPANGRYTENQWEVEMENKLNARRLRGVDTERQIVNLTVSDGKTEDKARVVFNEKKQQGYEVECDAAKFMSSGVPQLYTLDQRQARYAINERPLGEVRLGYMAAKQGELTIAAVRMDQPVLLRDNKLQITHDLAMGGYTFQSEAGTFDNRFTLVLDASTTGIAQLREQTGVSVLADQGGISLQGIGTENVSIYSLGGTQLVAQATDGFVRLPKAAYLVKVGQKTTKVIVR